MAVKIRVIGDLRRFLESESVESESVEIEGDGWTLSTAFDELVRLHPRLGKELFDERDRLHYAVVLRVDGLPAMWPQDGDRPIKAGGELLLTRFHTGG